MPRNLKAQTIRSVSHALTALVVALALFGVTAAYCAPASAHASAIPSDLVTSRQALSTATTGTGHGSGFAPNPKATPVSQVASNITRDRLQVVDLSAYNPPVGDQASVNSCIAWATGYYLLGWYATRNGYYPNGGFAADNLYDRIVYPHIAENPGTTFPQNLDLMRNKGIDTVRDVNSFNNGSQLLNNAQLTNAGAYGITSYEDKLNDNADAFVAWIRSTLASGNPIALGLSVYPELRYPAAPNGYVAAPTSGETPEPVGHAVFAYGYNQSGLWVENQWGTSWGNNGYGILSWDYVRQQGHEAVSIMPMSAPSTFQQLPGGAIDIAIDANSSGGGDTWVIGTNAVYGGYGIFHWNATTWTWEAVDGGAVRITIDDTHTPWVVNAFGNIFRRVNGVWQQVPGAARDIAAGAKGVWVIGRTTQSLRCRPTPCNENIYHWTGSDWQQFSGGALRIAIDGAGDPWAITSGGGIIHWTDSAWQQLPGLANDIACDNSGSVVVFGFTARANCWVIGVDGGIFQWHSTAAIGSHVESGSWVAIPGMAVAITVAPTSYPWVVNSGGGIFEYVD